MITYTTAELNEMTVKVLLKMAMQLVHPDKVSDEHKTQATEVFKTLRTLKKSDLVELLHNLYTNCFWVDTETSADGGDINIINGLKDLKDMGKTKKQARGWLSFEYDINDKDATEYLDAVYGGGNGGTNKADIVALIIRLQGVGMKNAEIASAINEKFGFAKSTGATIVSHIAYMVEYANQING